MANALDVAADLETIKQKFVGKWKLTKSEGLDDYLKFLGFNFVVRKFAATASSTVEISVEGDKIHLTTSGPKKSTHKACNLNTEFEDSDPFDNAVTAVATFEYGRLIINSTPKGNSKAKASKVVREISKRSDGKDEMIMTVSTGTVVMKRFFVRE